MPLKVRERKLTLAGAEHLYACELLVYQPGLGVLKYVIDQTYDIAGFVLSPGDETLAVYWEGRPYTLYIWFRKQQGDRAYYFNIADSVALRPGEFVWRDLAVDILVTPSGKVQVLDEQELPPDLPRGLLEYIMKTKGHILASFRDIIEEAENLLGTEHNTSKP